MQFVPWATVLLASIAAGAVSCAAMVAPRRMVPLLLAAEAAALAFAGVALGAIWLATPRLDQSIASCAIALGAFAGGYALFAGLLAVAPERRAHDGDIVIGKPIAGTHVIVLSDEEPEQYDPRSVTRALARYTEGDIRLPPEIGRPLIYASERSRYQHAAGSAARETVRSIAASLEERLQCEGSAYRAAVAFCDGTPSLHDTVLRIVAAGGRSIVVAPLAVAWSRAFTEAIDGIPLGALEAAGVTVTRAGPLWPSAHLSGMLARRALVALGPDHATAGVILLSEGDSWEHARSQDDYREQLLFFIQRVRAELVDRGIQASRIRRASLWLGEPDVTEAARHLAAVGAQTIVLVPASFACESIATRIDLPYAAERAQADTGTVVTTVAPWGNDPAVIEALRDAVCAVTEIASAARD